MHVRMQEDSLRGWLGMVDTSMTVACMVLSSLTATPLPISVSHATTCGRLLQCLIPASWLAMGTTGRSDLPALPQAACPRAFSCPESRARLPPTPHPMRARFVAPASGKRSREGVCECLRAVGVCAAMAAFLSFVAALIAVRWRRQALAATQPKLLTEAPQANPRWR